MAGRNRKIRQRFYYGQAAARRGVHVPSERGMTMQPGRAVGPEAPEKGNLKYYYKILNYLGYGPDHVRKFQYHWNAVVKANMISGGILAEDNIMGPKTRVALEAAFDYIKSMPKDWMYYVRKAFKVGPQSKPVDKAATRRRMGRRR